ncbi:RNA polymerase sigma factor [Spongiimicrobium sp. 2-473A-2-J]|uniref:RNA polymerase sigma factor n=1 Tax=Eudoraea algarum TaxID=3417568 RepID=UPI003D36B9D9
MNKPEEKQSHQLAEHFFRTEYGRLVSVITRYLGTANVQTAEDIVQETLSKAVDHWQQHGIPPNPQAWLYTTAKNHTLNILKRKSVHRNFEASSRTLTDKSAEWEDFEPTSATLSDNQLKMMFVCCHPALSENSQIALILKILCGFSIAEIAHAFFSSHETINKRLVRGRRQLRENKVAFEIPPDLDQRITIVLKTIYLLFNEGYFPSQKNSLIRYDLCLEAIRLVQLLLAGPTTENKADCHALLALMYLNASRFEARMEEGGLGMDMEKQDRKKWDQDLIQSGIRQLQWAMRAGKSSNFLILATISAHHCIAPNFEATDWPAILALYDQLIVLENSPLVHLNRSVALSKAEGNQKAIAELLQLESRTDIGKHYLFHATLGELYGDENEREKAIGCFEKAIALAGNQRDIALLKKKLMQFVPIR